MDLETRRKKQQTLMVQLVERKVRSRAKQLYETRGQTDGQALQDWFQAESEVLENSILAPLYRRMRSGHQDNAEIAASQETCAAGFYCLRKQRLSIVQNRPEA